MNTFYFSRITVCYTQTKHIFDFHTHRYTNNKQVDLDKILRVNNNKYVSENIPTTHRCKRAFNNLIENQTNYGF